MHDVLGNSVFQGERYSNVSGDNVSSIGTSSVQIRVKTADTCWFDELKDRFVEITSLREGWDGYRGKPVSYLNARFAEELLNRLCVVANVPAPSVVPGSDGTLQLEWHMNNYNVELDVLAPNRVEAYRFNIHTEEEEEYELSTNFTLLTEWIEDLVTYTEEMQSEVS